MSSLWLLDAYWRAHYRHPCSCQKNQLDYWACSSFFLPFFPSYSEDLVCSPCLCCLSHMVGDCSVQRRVSVPSPRHCPYSLWWLLMVNSGAHGAPCAACRYHNNHTLVSHWILAAVGFGGSAEPSTAQRCGAQESEHVQDWHILRVLHVQNWAVLPIPWSGQSCCSLIPCQRPWTPPVSGGCWHQKRFQCHPACLVGWQIHKFPEAMKK